MIEFLCTLAGMIAGGAIVASITGMKEQHAQDDFMHQLENLNTEKIRGITTQLHSLSERVLDNVCMHSEKIKSFGDELTSSEAIDADKILSAVDKIISANQQMQNDLENAQRQLAHQQEIIEQTTMQAMSDSLTGLANRRALDEHLGGLLNSKQDDECIGLLLMDIDHFKRFNDTYGHLTGDAVLTCFARLIQQNVRSTAFPARYGGEEFVVVLHGANEQELVEQAASVRKFVSEQTISHEDLELTITASAGLCMVQPGDNLTIAYERSDEGLYKAKELGRNRGLWLSKDGWVQFPEKAAVAEPATDLVQSDPSKPVIEETKSAATESEENSDTLTSDSTELAQGEDQSSNEADYDEEAAPAYMDLTTFVDKVRDHLNQLQQMDLPAACIMVEASIPGEESESRLSWQKVLTLIQTKVRGIDVLCHFRPMTVCIFLPGCSAEASYERASEVKELLLRSAIDWDLVAIPEKFAVAVGHVLEKEEVPSMLNRMESALDEAKHAKDEEIVVHDGASTQFLQL